MAISKSANDALRKRVQAALVASSQQQPLLAFASMDGALEASKDTAAELATRTLASYSCKACKTKFVAEHGSQPFCVTCGDHHVTAGAQLTAQETQRYTASLKGQALASVQCGSCGSSTVMLGALTTNNAHNHLNCVTCGTQLCEAIDEVTEKAEIETDHNVGHGPFEAKETPEPALAEVDATEKVNVEGNPLKQSELTIKDVPDVKAAADDFGDIPDDEDQIVIAEDDDDSDLESEDDDVVFDDDGTSFSADAADEVDAEDESDADADLDANFSDIADEAVEADADELPIETTDEVGDDDIEVIAEEGDSDEASDDAPAQSETEGGEEALSDEERDLIDNAFSTASTRKVTLSDFQEGEPIADVLGLDDTGDDVELASLSAGKGKGKYVAALKGSVVVARLFPQHAGINRSSMHSDGFRTAVKSLASRDGLRATLNDLGFKPIKVSVLSQVDVKKQVASVKAGHDKALTAYRKNLEESVALAAVGLDRDQWKGATNPLMISVALALTEFGAAPAVAKRVARRAVTSATQEYVKILLAQTDKIQSMPAAQRKMLAETFWITRAASESNNEDFDFEGEDDIDADGDDIVASFSAPLHATDPKVTAQAISASVGRSHGAVSQHNILSVLNSSSSLFSV